jgi:hypothetical protein
MTWISLQTPYALPVTTPNLSFTEPSNICANYGIESKGRCEAAKLVGFYNTRRTIYLPLKFEQKNLRDQSRLLHELVHYVQWYNKEHKKTCLGKLEAEAYRIQDKWLASQSLPPASDPFKLVLLEASCDT